MRLGIGLLLMLLGAAIMLAGIVLALRELGGLYQGVLDDPLGQPEGAEDAAREGMLRGVAIGAVGILPFLVGVFVFRGEVARRIRRRAQRRSP